MLKFFKRNLRHFSFNKEASLTKKEIPKIDHYNINLEDYRDLDEPIKHSTGYALLEVEPFPRLKIMKLSMIILKELQRGIPEDALYRIYTEEKFKYIMELTHDNKNISDLEDILGFETIEYFIEQMAREYDLIEFMRQEKPWEEEEKNEEDEFQFQIDNMTEEQFNKFKLKMTEKEKILLDKINY